MFGFGTNILVLAGLLRFVLKCPSNWCSAAFCPYFGVLLCLGYYAMLARNLARNAEFLHGGPRSA